ncbi:MAG: hypothetical protein EBS53_11730, partial [Bacteroidetes bacterium]|nr:hypothetical protein [Bacteroidota bacterium]
MRINLLTTTALMLCSGAAMADEHNLRPYIGAEVNYTNVDFRSSGGISYDEVFASGYKGVTPYVGLQLNKHVAIEAGYLQTSSENKDISPLISGLGFTGSTKTKLKGFHADVIGRLPV